MRTKTMYQLSFGGLLVLLITAFTVMWNEWLLRGLVRFAVGLLTVIGVMGCSTNSFAAEPPTAQSEAVFTHGQFTVRQVDGGQVVEGGVYTPTKDLPAFSAAAHVIFIDYEAKTLRYHRKVSVGSYEPVIGYAVMTPEPRFLPHSEVRGLVRAIDLRPSWCPKAQARRLYPNLPKGCVPHGHPDNMMGDAKFLINWQGVKGWEAVHLHGTMGYKAGAFWDQETLGCTRLTNEAILALVEKLGTTAVQEGIEVVLMRGQKPQESTVPDLGRLRESML